LVEEMTVDDLPQVLEIERRSYPRPLAEQAFRAEFENHFARRLVVRTRSGGPLAGFVIAWRAADELQINNVAVHPEHRRTGAARRLLLELLERQRQAGVRRVWLEVRRSNQAAQRLYGSLGFVHSGVRAAYYADNGEDALVMTCALDKARPAGSEG
jgi:ribosomal-protein-alanine N-acetyltransferase